MPQCKAVAGRHMVHQPPNRVAGPGRPTGLRRHELAHSFVHGSCSSQRRLSVLACSQAAVSPVGLRSVLFSLASALCCVRCCCNGDDTRPDAGPASPPQTPIQRMTHAQGSDLGLDQVGGILDAPGLPAASCTRPRWHVTPGLEEASSAQQRCTNVACCWTTQAQLSTMQLLAALSGRSVRHCGEALPAAAGATSRLRTQSTVAHQHP